MRYVVGLDVSTTGVKALLVDETGIVRGTALTEHPLFAPHPLWSEQNPQDWWAGTRSAVAALLDRSAVAASDIAAVGLTGQMHGLVLLDEAGSVIRPAILWNDQRTAAECDEIRAVVGRAELIRRTGSDALTGLTLPKLLWVKKHEPEVYARIAHVLLPKDYVRYRLTDGFATDKAGAAGTQMLDMGSRDWSEETRSSFGIPAEWLPKTHEGPEVTGVVSRDGARSTGLLEGTPVVAGAGDQAAQAIGVGAVCPGEIAVTLGTSGVVFCTTNGPTVDPEGRVQAFCHGIPDRWHLMGVMLSAAGSLRWFRDALAPGEDFASLADAAAASTPGAAGLLFLPYLSGERMPYPDPHVRGSFLGLTVRHDRKDMVRAVMEGVSYGLRDGLDLLSGLLGRQCHAVRVSGGGAQSDLWLRILASVLGVDLLRVNNVEGAAVGAALLAGVGGGLWPSVDEACERSVEVKSRVEPVDEWSSIYAKGHAIYRDAYAAVRDISHRLGDLERQ